MSERSKAFADLWPVTPPAFDQRSSTKTVTARLQLATAISEQLRCRYELLAQERNGDHLPVIGDEVLDAERADVLGVLWERLDWHARARLERWKSLRDDYGYAGKAWSDRPGRGESPHRVSLRVGICMAADATFAPYAYGVREAITRSPSALRIDIRAIGRSIWSWACDHQALARSLAVARAGHDGQLLGFPAFARLYAWALTVHLEGASAHADLAEEVDAAAKSLATISTAGAERASVPGSTPAGSIYTPSFSALIQSYPEWMPEYQGEEAAEAFARGSAQVVIEVVTEQRGGKEAVVDLEALSRGLVRVQSAPTGRSPA